MLHLTNLPWAPVQGAVNHRDARVLQRDGRRGAALRRRLLPPFRGAPAAAGRDRAHAAAVRRTVRAAMLQRAATAYTCRAC